MSVNMVFGSFHTDSRFETATKNNRIHYIYVTAVKCTQFTVQGNQHIPEGGTVSTYPSLYSYAMNQEVQYKAIPTHN